ncbi:AEC family transporter [Lutimaribacter marinistellae]|uniref:AEC family transporter n=1 Tax=Lutimaribacter marinistellae TaxID=1820329 RepID=A0ABV7TGB1_9RHOB
MLFITIWPIFALICLGHVLARRNFPSAEFWPAAERLNYHVLFPALLVSSLANAPVRDPQILRLGGATVLTILIAVAVLYALRAVHHMPPARFGPLVQGIVRFNTYLALSILATLEGIAGLERAAVYLAVAVPLVNVLAIVALSDAGTAHRPFVLIATVFRNPLVLACVIGACLALSEVGLPYGSDRFLKLMGEGSLPLGLLCVGAALRPASLRQDIKGLLGAGLARLLIMPVLAGIVARVFGLSGVEAMVLVVFSAVPAAPTAYVLTQQLKGDGPFMAGIVTFQTLLAVATIPAVLLLFSAL